MDILTPVEIFRAGRHTSMNNKAVNINIAELETLAANYDREHNGAPIVVGHPSMDAPAYGWVSKLTVEGDLLLATFDSVDEEFNQIVKDGKYRKISVALYPPKSQGNPKPDQYYLKHVGFLGATAPVVKGLKQVQFCANDNHMTFAENDIAYLPKKYSDMVLHVENDNFIEQQINHGRVLPCDKDGLLSFMDSIDCDNEMVFSEGSSANALDWFREYIGKQLPIVTFGESASTAIAINQTLNQSYDAPVGYYAESDALEVHHKALELSKQQNISYQNAVNLVYDNLS
ncbi:MAG: hypothetical protein HRU28_04420 [Rhizobiales bacterium]|nr:hypothetical protein [Hyphomicrobiales bacterium]